MKTNFLVLALILVFVTSCNRNAAPIEPTPTPTPKPTPTATPISVLNEGKILENTKSSDTEFQLYRFLASGASNVNFSPLSLKIAFSLIYPGSVGSTQKLLEQIFGFTSDKPNPYESEYKLAETTEAKKTENDQLIIQNSAWVKTTKGIKDTFRQSLKIQGAEIEKLDLDAINLWVAKATHDKIPSLLNSLDAGTRAIFINTIYFKQKWLIPFEVKNTSTDHFQPTERSSVNAPTLHAKKQIKYFEDHSSKWIGLDYADSPFQMLFALPIKRFDLHTVENNLNQIYLNKVIEKMDTAGVEMAIPKFKFNQMSSFKSLLKNAGYDELFSHGDYSGIATPSFVLSDVIQATSIEVNEIGTEASAATAVVMMGSAMRREPIFSKSFIANQPFLFVLRNKESKEIYWIGRVTQPLEGK